MSHYRASNVLRETVVRSESGFIHKTLFKDTSYKPHILYRKCLISASVGGGYIVNLCVLKKVCTWAASVCVIICLQRE